MPEATTMPPEPRIALVSRALFPFGGGGIAEYVWATARTLSGIGEVTVITTSAWKPEHRRLLAMGDPRVIHANVRTAFVDDATDGDEDQDEVGTHWSASHLYSTRVFDRLLELYPDGGPDLVEFGDYRGEGFVTVQARHSRDPRLRRTRVCVRAHTTAEVARLLNGDAGDDRSSRCEFDMERYVLAHSDALLHPGGDVLGTYRRYYHDVELAPEHCIRNPFNHAVAGEPAPERAAGEPEADAPLRMLYLGRLERRKGVENLVEAVTALPGDDWTLTLLGGDMHTGPLRTSMKRLLEVSAEGDERVRFADEVPRSELPRVIADHDVVVLPSLWECWPYVALEAMRLNRPVVATPTGGFVEIVDAQSGWLTRDATASSLFETLEGLVGDPASVRAKTLSSGPRARFDALSGDAQIRDGYRRLLADRPIRPPRPRGPAPDPPAVSVVLSYYKLDEFVERAISSLADQTYERVEVIVVNDGSFREEDRILADLAARWPITVVHQPNSGLGAARNFGISQSVGRYVLPMDSDNELEPTFIERCLPLLEEDPSAAYVTTWAQFIDEESRPFTGTSNAYYPLGNWSRLLPSENVAGDATALIPRRIFDRGYSYSTRLTSYEDWAFYRELASAGLYGQVVPERLLRYRIRAKSMLREVGIPNEHVLMSEREAHVREREVAWQVKGG